MTNQEQEALAYRIFDQIRAKLRPLTQKDQLEILVDIADQIVVRIAHLQHDIDNGSTQTRE